MALSQSSLSSALMDIFDAMRDGSKNDTFFVDELCKAVMEYASAGTVTTSYSGMYGSATITAATGTGSPNVQDSLMAAPIKAIMPNHMPGGNPALANAIASGSQAMLGAPGTLSQTVTGAAVSPNGSPVPVSGTSTGQLIPVMAPVAATLQSIFSGMNNMSSGGDKYFADQLAGAIHGAFAGSPASTILNGTGVGTGSVS